MDVAKQAKPATTKLSLFPKRDIEAEIKVGSDGFPEGYHLRKEFPYLRDVKADFRLAGFPAAWYPFMSEVSPARLTMYGKHQAQAVVVARPQLPHCYSGLEADHGTYATNTARREEDVEILTAIPKYRVHHNNLGAKEIPSWLVIYRGLDSKEINAFEIRRYEARAEGWGYRNNWNDSNIRKYLREGELLLKDTELSTPPTVSGPRYMTGTNAQVCYMPISEADQDAIVISDRLAEALKAFGLMKRQGIIPPNYIPMPIHATEEYPEKWFLDVGERVPEDGTVCVFRKMNIDRFSSDASAEAMKSYDPNLDIVIKGEPGSIVADVNFLVNKQYLEEIPQQVRMYVEDNRQYYKNIIDIYNKYPQSKIGDHFNRIVLEAACRLVGLNEKVFGIDPKGCVAIEGFKNSIVDYIHVEFSFFYEIPVGPGTKLSGRSGMVYFSC